VRHRRRLHRRHTSALASRLAWVVAIGALVIVPVTFATKGQKGAGAPTAPKQTSGLAGADPSAAPTSNAAPTGAAPGSTPLASPPSAESKRYIVVLKDDVADPGAMAAEHAQSYGARVTHVYGSALKGYAASVARLESQSSGPTPRSSS
jgi:hypothetical protein